MKPDAFYHFPTLRLKTVPVKGMVFGSARAMPYSQSDIARRNQHICGIFFGCYRADWYQNSKNPWSGTSDQYRNSRASAGVLTCFQLPVCNLPDIAQFLKIELNNQGNIYRL
jgi:hypothetical protein